MRSYIFDACVIPRTLSALEKRSAGAAAFAFAGAGAAASLVPGFKPYSSLNDT